MTCQQLECDLVFTLVSDHRWGDNTIPIQALIGMADKNADFDEKEEAFDEVSKHPFVERVRHNDVRIQHMEELIEFLSDCDYDLIEIRPRLKRKYPEKVFEKYF